MALLFSSFGRDLFSLTLIHSLTHMLEHKSTISVYGQNISEFCLTVNFRLTLTAIVRAQIGTDRHPCKEKRMVIKEKDQGGVAERRRGAKYAWQPRSGAVPSGRKCCEEWQCQSEPSLTSLDLSICLQ